MATGIIGRKLGMTRVFAEDGTAVPVTVIEAGPCHVLQVRERRRSLAGAGRPRSASTRAELGHAKAPGSTSRRRSMRSFPLERRRTRAGCDGDRRNLRGRRPGQGDRHYQGSRLPGRRPPVRISRRSGDRTATRVTASRARSAPGTDPSRVIKGKRMPGHMGDERHTEMGLTRRQDRRRAQPAVRARRRFRAPRTASSPLPSREGRAAMINAPHFSSTGASTPTRLRCPATRSTAIVNEDVLHQAVKEYLANQRQGTAKTKTRARSFPVVTRSRGSRRAPAVRAGFEPVAGWRGGGTVFGPIPRDYRVDTNRKVRQLARRSALNARAREGMLHIVDPFTMAAPKTQHADRAAGKLVAGRDAYADPHRRRPSRRCTSAGATCRTSPCCRSADATAYDILRAEALVIESAALGDGRALLSKPMSNRSVGAQGCAARGKEGRCEEADRDAPQEGRHAAKAATKAAGKPTAKKAAAKKSATKKASK